MSSLMTTRETNRLHRWAMWRMTVNEGIISCIRENGTTRVIYPESATDSEESLASEVAEFHEFPFITAEQMSLARKLNLREKYGSKHGLSDDAYFIFGLPRISVGKDIPEVTSTGTRSVYESFSEMGDTLGPGDCSNQWARGPPGTSTGTGMGMGTSQSQPAFNRTYSELEHQTPDAMSLESHNDTEVQTINGYPEMRKRFPSGPHYSPSNLYGHIPEGQNNNNNNYYSNGYSNVNNNTNSLPSARRYFSDRYQDTPVDHRDSPAPINRSYYSGSGLVGPFGNEGIGQGLAETNNERSSLRHYNMNVASLQRQRNDASYLSFPSNSGHQSRSVNPPPPARLNSFSPLPSSSSSSTNAGGHTYSSFPEPRHKYPTLPLPSVEEEERKGYFPPPVAGPSGSSRPSSGEQTGGSAFPWTGAQQKGGVGSPGYGNKMRPTTLLSDGDAERMKRQAYYDWTTPTKERQVLMDFTSLSRYG